MWRFFGSGDSEVNGSLSSTSGAGVTGGSLCAMGSEVMFDLYFSCGLQIEYSRFCADPGVPIVFHSEPKLAMQVG